ncbi:MAG: hypothetical protein OXH99_25930 [Bryobacterales bacterium]|nr:hypothetical protein [Bryobacterales bacterium]
MAVDSTANVYVVDWLGHRVRKIHPAGVIATFTGTGEPGSSGNGGLATETELWRPKGVAEDRAGNVFIAGDGHGVRKVDTSGVITGFASDVHISAGGALATDALGRVYAGGDRQILRIDNGEMSIVAGTGEDGYSGDSGPALSARFSVVGIAVDRFGNVWIADHNSRRIRVLRRQDRRP